MVDAEEQREAGQTMVEGGEGGEQLVKTALELNAKRQEALKARLDELNTKLSKLGDTINQVEAVKESDLPETEDTQQNIVVTIPGSFKPVGILTRTRIAQPDSPFHHDAMRRQRYLDYTSASSLFQKEQDAIQKHVIFENKRIWAMNHPGQAIPKSLGDGYFLDNLAGLDWKRIAAGVSADIALEKSARSCQIRWLSDLHPRVNREPWSHEERERMLSLVGQYKDRGIDWNHIAQALNTGRRPYDCIWQCLKTKTGSWTSSSEKELLDAVTRFGENNWQLVALSMNDHFNATQCSARYQQLNSTAMSSAGPWTEEEDDMLRRAIIKCGTSNFTAVARLVPGRTRNQCRERWVLHLEPRPVARTQWSAEEDEKLISAVKTLREEYATSTSWRTVSMMLGGGKSEVECQTRYGELTKADTQNTVMDRFSAQLQPRGTRFSARDRRRHALRRAATTEATQTMMEAQASRQGGHSIQPVQGLTLTADGGSIQEVQTRGAVHHITETLAITAPAPAQQEAPNH